MSELIQEATYCEVCGKENPEKFSAFELESYDIKLGEGKKFYDICFSCFHKLSEAPLQTEEVKRRLQENSKNLQQKIKEGLVCPKCKTLILDENHICPI